MLFKLPKSAVIAVCCFLAQPEISQAVPADILGYRGQIFSLRGSRIQSADVRSDGRYLFYTTGGASFSILDLIDMARKSEEFALGGSGVGVFMDGTNRLIVATSKGVEYFDISKPLKPKAETNKFTIPTSQTDFSVYDSCLASDRRVVLLERKSDDTLRIEVVSGTSSTTSATWRDLSSTTGQTLTVKPVAVRCKGGSAFVFGTPSGMGNSDTLWIRSIDIASLSVGSPATFSEGTSYRITDFLVTEKQDQLLLLFNRSPAPASGQESSDDSLVRPLNFPALTSGAAVGIGSKAKALSSFKVGDGFQAGLFVAVDKLGNASDSANKLLLAALPLTTTGQIQNDRGPGSTTVGSLVPSRWLSSKSDHYKYGLTESTGISLIGQGPTVEITQAPSSSQLTAANPLKFKLKADRDVTLAIYFNQSYSLDGDSTGLTREPGTLIRRTNLRKDEETPLEVSVADLGVTTDRKHSLSLLASDSTLNAGTAPLTRLGIPFTYDPPPGPVKNIKLRSGDSSIWVFFDPPKAEDLASYQIYFSYNSVDVSGSAFNAITFPSGVSDKSLSSPVVLAASEFDESYAIHPVQNFREMFVRVIAVDKSGQKSDPSELVSKVAYPTLTIPQALGAPDSCALKVDGETGDSNVIVYLLLSIFFSFGILGLRRI